MKIFSVSNIQIRIDSSFWFLPVILSVWTAANEGVSQAFRMFVLILCVFLLVIGHELSHSFRAQSLGIRVPVITLYPMGGVASMMRIPKNPWHEFSISIAGPLFNLILAGALYFPVRYFLGERALFSPSLDSWPETAANLYWVNLALGLFNLIPAFPMDGGRILRSFLALKLKYLTATRISVFLGQIFAILFFLLGVWKSRWMLALVGLYVYFAASNEMKQTLREDRTEKLKTGDHELS